MEHSPVFRLIVGLGNPGDRYLGTRHNIGFEIVGELSRRHAVDFAFEPRWNAAIARCGGRTLMRPQTFMNLSGQASGDFARFHKITPQEVLVILDDAALPLGELRIRPTGSSGGHNGLESVLVHFGTESVPRLRVGIGEPGQIPLDEFVLSKFAVGERVAVEAAILRAADATEQASAHGVETAMNQYNQKQKP